MEIIENKKLKRAISEDYNYVFSKSDGCFVRWGKTGADDPIMAPGPEIADIEISTICHGPGAPCSFCYKSNNPNGKNMSLGTFKKVFAKLPKTVCQIAFGIGDVDANPDMIDIFDYCRDNGVIPNVTINGYRMTQAMAKSLARVCGAVAVSRYENKFNCYMAVRELLDFGLKQVNIHQMVCKENINGCLETIEDVIAHNSYLVGLNAVVFLTLKPKGNRNNLTLASKEDYKFIIDKCLTFGVRFGFDSCSANRFLEIVGPNSNHDVFAEPCESALFSCYINVDGDYFPCSFADGEPGWEKGISVLECEDFTRDVWNNPRTIKFREELLAKGRSCPLFNI